MTYLNTKNIRQKFRHWFGNTRIDPTLQIYDKTVRVYVHNYRAHRFATNHAGAILKIARKAAMATQQNHVGRVIDSVEVHYV